VTLSSIAVTWSVDRAAGIAALLLATSSIVAGTFVGARAAGDRAPLLPRADLRPLHEALALATLAAIAIHLVSFAVDGFFKAGLTGALVPFASPFRPVAVTAGQVAAYGIAVLSLTYYARRRIGPARWRVVHRAIAAFWGLAVIHSAFAGSDALRPWLVLVTVPPVVVAIGLVARRHASRAAASAPQPGAGALAFAAGAGSRRHEPGPPQSANRGDRLGDRAGRRDDRRAAVGGRGPEADGLWARPPRER
jgi:methionine sulfoxide reductase heme-binding subunit